MVRNGIFKYYVYSLYGMLDYLDRMGDVTVHISLYLTIDDSINDVEGIKEYEFQRYCRMIDVIFINSNFCGGERTFDGKVVYEFRGKQPLVFNAAKESLFYRLATIFFPRIVKMLNKKYIKKYNKLHNILLLNHVALI